jgi:thiol-disulfide isomerase/thioredoxin
MKIIPVCIGLLLSCFCHAQGYRVKIKLNNFQNYKIKMTYFLGQKMVTDSSAVLENGWMVFKGKVDEPLLANLSIPENPALKIAFPGGSVPGPYLNFFLTNEEIEITGNANTIYSAKVVGGKANKDWSSIKSQEMELEGASWKAIKMLSENRDDKALAATAARLFQEKNSKRSQLQKEFIATNPNSLVSMYFLSEMINTLSYEELQATYDKLGKEYKQISYGKDLGNKLQNLQKTAVGKTAIPINKKDINGNVLTLEALKGKYVLLDFWGSWCGPCRASHPHLIELYGKYKDRGFEIVGIADERGKSLEENKRTWKKAIAEDGMTWLQVLNNEDQEVYDVVNAYAITAFPTKLLLDKQGKVIFRTVGSGREIDEQLKKIFGN